MHNTSLHVNAVDFPVQVFIINVIVVLLLIITNALTVLKCCSGSRAS